MLRCLVGEDVAGALGEGALGRMAGGSSYELTQGLAADGCCGLLEVALLLGDPDLDPRVLVGLEAIRIRPDTPRARRTSRLAHYAVAEVDDSRAEGAGLDEFEIHPALALGKNGMPPPTSIGQTLARYSSIRPNAAASAARVAPPIAMSPGEPAGRCGLARNTHIAMAARAPDLSGGVLDGRYELHALIGEGSFGRVYRGLDRRLARTVAVKVIKPWWAEDGAWVERFEREAQLLARVSDPGIVQIYDIGHAENDGPYYVAEFVDGESLAALLRRGPLPPRDARAVAEQLCEALAGAHAQGVVHCALKPANVLIAASGQIKVGDFGVARLAEGTSQAPSATVAGTPRYMSPEQARGQPTGPPTDVYSAGVVLYEMLAGEPPFTHGSAVELGLRHLQDEPPRLPLEVPGAPGRAP